MIPTKKRDRQFNALVAEIQKVRREAHESQTLFYEQLLLEDQMAMLERCKAEAQVTSYARGVPRPMNHQCILIDDHTGAHECGCGYQWGMPTGGQPN